MIFRLLALALFAFSCEAFVAPASPALSRSVVSAPAVQMFSGGSSSKAKKVVKKVVKKVAKKPVKKPVKKVVKKVVKKAPSGSFKPGKQMPANQAVSALRWPRQRLQHPQGFA